VENIAYEVFSPFAAAFEEVRKVRLLLLIVTHPHSDSQVEIDFFLSHWHNIRTSGSMKNVWVQIRNGRHPGFEEGWLYNIICLLSFDGLLMIQYPVWPLIAQSLEFKPTTPSVCPSNEFTL